MCDGIALDDDPRSTARFVLPQIPRIACRVFTQIDVVVPRLDPGIRCRAIQSDGMPFVVKLAAITFPAMWTDDPHDPSPIFIFSTILKSNISPAP
jgi:hypothetical protein